MNLSCLIVLFFLLQVIFLMPIKDKRSRERGFPWATVIIIVINVLVHLGVMLKVYTLTLDADANVNVDLLTHYLLYPYMEVPHLIKSHQGLGALSSLTSTYLHGGMSHLLGNMFFLWFFGRKVEDATGPINFVLLYTLCGFTSSFLSVTVQTALTGGFIPGLGASGAIFGIMGAYFFLYSDEKILTLVSTWLAPIVPVVPGICLIPIPFPVWLPTWVFIVYKMVSDALLGQVVFELSKVGQQLNLGVGIFAHMGGAIGGMLFVYLFMHPEVFAGRR